MSIFVQHLILAEPHHSVWELPWVTDFSGVATACGTLLYLFEGQTIVLPLENKLRDPQRMIGRRGVLSLGMALVTAIYLVVGLAAYLTYGADLKGSVTLNLPHRPLFALMNLMIVLVPFFGFVLQLYVVVDAVWPAIAKRLRSSKLLSTSATKNGWSQRWRWCFERGSSLQRVSQRETTPSTNNMPLDF